jgi:penicillin amidase
MRPVQLPGGGYMPRVQSPTWGASERMAVAPGHEADAYFHMPCGQSGHPLSPHYRDSHPAWIHGEPTPLLPGPPEHTLTLMPE